MIYHIIAFSIGIVLDLLIGDPYWMPHPIRCIGSLIHLLDKRFMDSAMNTGSVDEQSRDTDEGDANLRKRNASQEKGYGVLTVIIVLLVTGVVTSGILFGAYCIYPWVGVGVEAILTCYCLAMTSLRKESMKVCNALEKHDVEGARYAVSMIVGRDTKSLDAKGIAKAAVETVAENTSDGVIAPMVYLFIGGPILGLLYKAVNTMDSMIGYHNDRYEYFGKAAAKLDDAVNYIPARLSAIIMVLAAFLFREFDGKRAWRIFRRDRYNHKSPNSAQTESVCAGALGVQLAGDASYFGKIVHKPYIGDSTRDIVPEDIRRANELMYGTAFLLALVCIIVGIFFLT